MDTNEIKRKYYSLMLIQNDCETLKQICLSIHNSIFSVGIIPYMALFCRSVQEYLGIELISPEIDSEIYDIRNSIKVYGDKYGKGKKRFLGSDEMQNQEFREMLRFEFTKELNIHYNLGIYFDDKHHIIGNTQLFADVLKMNGLSNDEKAKKAFSLGRDLASIIGSVAAGCEKSITAKPFPLCTELPEFHYADINTNRSLFFNSFYKKDVNLFMLHIVSNLGFVSYVLEKVVGRNNPWLFRTKYLVTYYSFLGLHKLKQHLENETLYDAGDLIKAITRVVDSKDKLFLSKFRNCMMHYDLVADGSFAISDAHFDNKKPLYGLVEDCFNGLSYDDFFDLITALSKEIEDFLVSQFNYSCLRIMKL